jgi:hypothetical protein
LARAHPPSRASRVAAESGPERPPFLGTWRRVYALVLGFLLLQIVLYAAFSRAFS